LSGKTLFIVPDFYGLASRFCPQGHKTSFAADARAFQNASKTDIPIDNIGK
jgi:hypothetical protein